MNPFPEERILSLNQAPIRPDADFVLYWMIGFRRAHWNFSLQRAADWARELGKPLLILEALRCDYPWASERLHSFILEGMKDNESEFKRMDARYYPFVERRKGEGKGLVKEIASRSCLVVTDDFPSFFLPPMIRSVAKNLPAKMEGIDSNGLLPMRSAERAFLTAYSFRRYLQQRLPRFLDDFPKENPLAGLSLPVLQDIPAQIANRWPAAGPEILDALPAFLGSLPVEHSVQAVETKGGAGAAKEKLAAFLHSGLGKYHTDRNHPDENATSGLSPYLHFGHISVHQIFSELGRIEQWSPENLSTRAVGQREGWWGMSPGAEAFLDQLVTWRELGFNMCSTRDDYDRFDSLPEWAKEELAIHKNDPRQYAYTLEEFESARTHDSLWNGAQRQLLSEGGIHNYLRMLWGKKILEWTASPREALETMIWLNNKYALDGRDPNSYTGIFWVLGRYDRPFGPKRPIFGKIRYMSSKSTIKKLKLAEYMHRFARA